MKTFGDILYERISNSRSSLFLQGEVAQLTFQAFHKYVEIINETKDEVIEVTYPVGYTPDNKPINSTHKYSKQDLIERYNFLALNQLPINAIYQLVTTTEALLGDILRETLLEFPTKISNKRKLDAEVVLNATSLDQIKVSIVNSILNELAYKSPRDFAEEFNKYIGINLLEKPTFHKYIELKATRDIYIHNQGIANEIYLIKADTLARVKSGQFLPVDIQYFLQSYECCLQITEILEESLHKIWPSPEYVKNKNINIDQEKKSAIDDAIEHAEIVEDKIEVKKAIKKKPKKTTSEKK